MFDNPDDALWPNQFVNVRLLLETHKNSIVIPSVAVQSGPQGSYVFTVKPDKTVAVSPVTVSFTQNNVASIASGVARRRRRGDRRAGQAAGRQQSGSARRWRGNRTGTRQPSAAQAPACSRLPPRERHESVAAFYSSSGRDDAADGRACCWWAWSPTRNFRSPRFRKLTIPPFRS